MSCDEYRDGVLDLARDVASVEDAGRVRSHLEACAACAAWVDEQRALTANLRALAAATVVDRQLDGLEQRLLAAFGEQHAAGPGPAHRPAATVAAARPARASWQVWLRAAAVLVLGVSAFAWWQLTPARDRTTKEPAAPRSALRQATPPADAAAPVAVTEPVNVASPAPAPAQASPVGVAAHRPAARRTAPPPVVATGFVALGSAATLPAFERGEIIRVEIPVTSLPVYGIAIPPGAGGGLVQADLLVGQDGLVRAARLVTNELVLDSRNKQ